MPTSLVSGLGGDRGFGENFLVRNDDQFTGFIDLSPVFGIAGISFFGSTYNGLYLNNNGSVTFASGLSTFTPTAITGSTSNPIIAPFWADVDTRPVSSPVSPGGTSTGSNLLWYDIDTVSGRFTATWDDVGYYSNKTDKTNAFQLTLQRVGDAGDFDIVFRYEDVNWTTGDASGGSGGLGGTVARAGYSSGNGVNYFELPQSGNQAAILDLENTSNVGISGTYIFSVRGGTTTSSVSIGDATVVEGNGGTPNFAIVPVYLAAPSSTTITVRYATANGTAIAGQDFVAQGGLLTFAPGVTQQNIFVEIIGETALEPDETFVVNLLSANGGPIGDAQGSVTILADDGFAISGVQALERTAGTPTPFVFTVTLLTASANAVSVNYATENGTATAGSDFTAASGTLTFAAGETSKTVTVQVVADGVSEADETFGVRLSGAIGAGISTAFATGTILNDDGLVIDDVAVVEGTASTPALVTVTVRLLTAAAAPVSVDYATVAGTAAAGTDYTSTSGTLTFAAGETSKTFQVPVVRDQLTEAAETFQVLLSNPSGAAIVDGSATVTINDDDGFSISDAFVTEGNSGTKVLTFTVSLGSALPGAASVSFATANGTATAGSDYVASSGTLSFAAGETSKTVSVTINGDLAPEATETFTVNLSGPTGGIGLVRASATGSIVNDDGASVLDTSVTEGNSGTRTVLVTVQLSAAATAPVSLTYATQDGTATAGVDYVAANGTLSFAAGESSKTISVTVNGDTVFEGNETFRVLLSNPVGTGIVDGAATVVITNDDTRPPPSFRVIDASMVEGTGAGNGIMRFQVALSETSASALSVSYATTDGTATAGSDYVASTGTLTIPAGSLFGFIEVPVIRDAVIEGNETFSLTLSNPTGGSAIASATATGTILNDDVRFSLVPPAAPAAEGTGTDTIRTFTIQREGVSDFEHAIDWAVTGGTADAADFSGGSLPAGTIHFAPGETSREFHIGSVGDSFVEPDETFTVTLSNATNGATIGTASANSAIINDDTEWAIAEIAADRTEGDSGVTPFTFTISRLGLAGAATVNWSVDAVLSQTSAADFAGGTVPSGSVSFAAGEMSKSLTVEVAGDITVEGDETFFVRIVPPAGQSTFFNTATAVIRNDDSAGAGAVSIGDASVTEGTAGTTQMTFTLTRSGGAGAFAVDYIAQGGSALISDNDFNPTSGTVTFAAGENSRTITVDVVGDLRREANENFTVLLSNGTNGVTIADGSGTGTIVNDDANHAPVGSIRDFVVYLDRTFPNAALTYLVDATDADGDAITHWQFWDQMLGGGSIVKNGVAQPGATLIDLTASEFQTAFHRSADSYDAIWFRASDGEAWSDWMNFYVVAPVNHAPVVTPANFVAYTTRANPAPLVSSLVGATDSDGDAIQNWQFWDSTPDAGSFVKNGVTQAAGTVIDMTATEFATARFQTTSGYDGVWARAWDGQTWSDWTSFWVVAPVNHAPVVTPASTVSYATRTNPAPLLSSLVAASDADGDTITHWRFWDGTAGSGAVIKNGVQQADNTLIDMTAAEFAGARFQTTSGYDAVYASAWDGHEWSAWSSFWMVAPPNALPVLSPLNTTFNGAGVSRALTQIGQASDADGDAIQAVELWDGTPGSGFFSVNGVAQSSGTLIHADQANIANTTFTSGPVDDNTWVRVYDGYGWSDWTYLKMDNLLA